MNGLSTYEALRHFADSWGLAAMVVVFVVLVAWPLRPSARADNETAANVIFREDQDWGDENGQ